MKWDNMEGRMSNPMFKNVTINNTLKPVETKYFNFVGCFSPEKLTENDKTVLYLGDGNSLFYSNGAKTINAFHAYFKANINLGDVNGDGIISVSDVMTLVKIILGGKGIDVVVNGAEGITLGGSDNVPARTMKY